MSIVYNYYWLLFIKYLHITKQWDSSFTNIFSNPRTTWRVSSIPTFQRKKWMCNEKNYLSWDLMGIKIPVRDGNIFWEDTSKRKIWLERPIVFHIFFKAPGNNLQM